MSHKIVEHLSVPGDSDSTKAVVVTYGGSTALTIDPAIASVSTLKKSGTIQILKSGSKNEFSDSEGNVIASVWNRNDVDKVEIKGGVKVTGTTPFTVTVKLTE